MSAAQTIRVNFAKPIPVFPLNGVVLLPHAVIPLHIFEPRYRQMVESSLDGAGQIAMATFAGPKVSSEKRHDGPIKPAVCLGQIAQHEKLEDGRYNILLQGVCRARIESEHPPEGERLYRMATLLPLGATSDEDEESLAEARDRMHELLSSAPLNQLSAAESITQCLDGDSAPTSAVLELISVSIVNDPLTKYALLEEPEAMARARIIERELLTLRSLLHRAERQIDEAAPRGVTWN